jgi:hypothetical protein
MHYERAIDVRAPREILWRALADVREWPNWTPTIDEAVLLDDDLGPGARVRMRQPKLRTMIYTVDVWEPGTRFSWAASTAGVRVYADHVVQPDGSNSRLLLSIDMTGPMAPLMAALVGSRTRRYADTESDGTRRYAEHLAARPDAA